MWFPTTVAHRTGQIVPSLLVAEIEDVKHPRRLRRPRKSSKSKSSSSHSSSVAGVSGSFRFFGLVLLDQNGVAIVLHCTPENVLTVLPCSSRTRSARGTPLLRKMQSKGNIVQPNRAKRNSLAIPLSVCKLTLW